MNKDEESEIKKEFQLERVILFTDAIFAIIITIMVLEIRLPEGMREADPAHIQRAFIQLIPKFFAYLLSFFIVSRFWVSHLRIFAFLKDYNAKLISYNLLFLFFVSLFPFAVSLISGNISLKTAQYAWGFYVYIGIVFSGIYTQTLLIRYLVINKEQLCFAPNLIEQKLKWKTLRYNLYMIPVIVLIMAGLSFLALPAYMGIYVFLFYLIIVKQLTKKYYPNDAENDNTSFLKSVFTLPSKRKNKLKQVEDQSESR